jgi:hypothetical protein
LTEDEGGCATLGFNAADGGGGGGGRPWAECPLLELIVEGIGGCGKDTDSPLIESEEERDPRK